MWNFYKLIKHAFFSFYIYIIYTIIKLNGVLKTNKRKFILPYFTNRFNVGLFISLYSYSSNIVLLYINSMFSNVIIFLYKTTRFMYSINLSKLVYNLLMPFTMLFVLYNIFYKNNLFYIHTYIIFIFFMFLLLLLFTILYIYFGYKVVFIMYMQAYAISLPILICSLIVSLFYDFDILIMARANSYIFQNKFNIFCLRFDNLSVVFSTTTFIIGFFTGLFQYIYMLSDTKKDRFFFFLNYFIFSMVLLVHSSNFILMLLFWEFLGITSFFLISHYDSRYLTIKSALKAFSFNRLSDVLMLLFVSIQYYKNGHFYMFSVDSAITEFNVSLFPLLLLIISAFIKSAQLFFFFWLPDSMEAPIPASALIHSATLVSAGIYILLRFRYSILLCPILCKIIIYLPAITLILFTPFIFVQTDLKRLLALSTVVNISFLYIMIILLDTKYVCFYFIIHGLFKSCSFLILGFLILFNKHSQDYRSYIMGIYNPSYAGFLMSLCILVLSGSNVFFTYSVKHLIMYNTNIVLNNSFILDLTIIVYSMFSILYGLKVVYFVCIKKTKNSIYKYEYLGLKNYNLLLYMNNVVSFYFILSTLLSMLLYVIIFKSDVFITNSLVGAVVVNYNSINFNYLFIVISLSVYVLFIDNRYALVLFLYTILLLSVCII